MKITVIGRKCTPRDSFKERAEKRLKKVEKFFGSEAEAKITATVDGQVINNPIFIEVKGLEDSNDFINFTDDDGYVSNGGVHFGYQNVNVK